MVLSLLPLHRLASGLRWRQGCGAAAAGLLSPDGSSNVSKTLSSEEQPVHHTFIHYDLCEEDEQPDIQKSVSNILDGVRQGWREDAEVETHIHDIVENYRSKTARTPSHLSSGSFGSTTASDEETNQSLGSVKHALGRCKPCAWHRKPSGCSKGDACTFCHSCGADALRKKKKDRLERVKQHRRNIRERTAAAEAAAAAEVGAEEAEA